MALEVDWDKHKQNWSLLTPVELDIAIVKYILIANTQKKNNISIKKIVMNNTLFFTANSATHDNLLLFIHIYEYKYIF